ncbi:hypothetical protein BH09ACT6_BH09ACT6_22080 [soil metagenome]
MAHLRRFIGFRTLSMGVAMACALGILLLGASSTAQALSPDVGVGNRPKAIALDTNTGDVFVVNSGTSTVSRFDGRSVATPTPDTITIGGTDVEGIAVDPVSGRVFVADANRNSVAYFDGTSATPTVKSVAVGNDPRAVAVDPTSGRVFVTNNGDKSVSILDGRAPTPRVLPSTVAVGLQPDAVAVDSSTHSVFVTNLAESTVSVFDGSLDSPIENTPRIAVPEGPTAIAVDSDTHTVFVASVAAGLVSWFDSRQAVPPVDSMPAGIGVVGIAVDPANFNVFVVNYSSNTVLQFDGRDPKRSSQAQIPVGSGPFGVVTDSVSGRVFVTIENKNSVAVLFPNPVYLSPTITSGPPSAATVGIAYSFTFTATGQSLPTFTLQSQAPPGLLFDAATATISGTPTAAGDFANRVTAQNHSIITGSASMDFTLTVNPATVTPTPTPTPGSTGTSTPADTGGSHSVPGNSTQAKPQLAHTGLDLTTFWPLIAVGAMLVVTGAISLPRRTPRSTRTSE